MERIKEFDLSARFKRAAVDGIATHCGFAPRTYYKSQAARDVITACDAWARRRKLIWVPSIADYLPIDAAAAALAALGRPNNLFS